MLLGNRFDPDLEADDLARNRHRKSTSSRT
jgi:hypothetical protein